MKKLVIVLACLISLTGWADADIQERADTQELVNEFIVEFPNLGKLFQTVCSLSYNGFGSPQRGSGDTPKEACTKALDRCLFFHRSTPDVCFDGVMACKNSKTGVPFKMRADCK